MGNGRFERKKSPVAWRRLLRRMMFVKEHKKEFEKFTRMKGTHGFTIGPGENKELSVFCGKMKEDLQYSPKSAKCDVWTINYMLYLDMKKQKII